MPTINFFPQEEYDSRITRVRERMATDGLDGCLISSPENVYYLTGLNHQGYFAYQLLVLPMEGKPVLITRTVERSTVRDQAPGVRHICYSDGVDPLPAPKSEDQDLVYAGQDEHGEAGGLNPWSMSIGVPTRDVDKGPLDLTDPARVTCDAIKEAGLESARLGIEKNSSFFPFRIAENIVSSLPKVHWVDASTLVGDCRLIQSPRELKCTRQAAVVSDSMMLAAIAAAGSGVYKRDVLAALYQAMFMRGGTYPGFVPLVRSTRTIEHEHGTWQDDKLVNKDLLFLEMAGCRWRYHAPIGRLVYIGKAPPQSQEIHDVCLEAQQRAIEAIKPGVQAREVYQAWQKRVDEAGLHHYRRHHCGYAVGIGFPPSWSGAGVPLGLRSDSTMELQSGMVFHLMSWLLRTGRGDSFLSDTVVVTNRGCEVLTKAPRLLFVR